MARKSSVIWFLLVVLLWNFPVSQGINNPTEKLRNCSQERNKSLIVPDKFYGVITAHNISVSSKACIIFLQKTTEINKMLDKWWPQVNTNNSLLYITSRITQQLLNMTVLRGRQCNTTTFDVQGCNATFFSTNTVCENGTYDEDQCTINSTPVNDRFIINITLKEPVCYNCESPVRKPDVTFTINGDFNNSSGEMINPAAAVNIMSKMSDIVSSLNGSSAELKVGEGITGIIVVNKDPVDINEVSFAYTSPNASIDIVGNKNNLEEFSRSVTVPKEAFEKALTSKTVTFAALMRFPKMANDNSTILGNEILAVEMGANITNLTNPINITFKRVEYKGTPSCHSWNGDGSEPKWTDEGCNTTTSGSSITCQCSHMTFFAILMAPVNETISSSDLNNLTIITQVGCGLSMLFLSIILFMHFLLRKSQASKATQILIQLALATFLLNFTFLINNYVASMNNSVSCKIIAALMHYFMLTTFTWFAVHAFHICLQLYTGGKIVTRRYILKVCVTSWGMPSIAGIVLLITEKYGKQVIYTDNPSNSAVMCWITDNHVHYIVNIGYYVLVFLFTFTTFIIIISWLICLKKNQSAVAKANKNGRSIVSILGLCCMLGIAWGFAFFAYGIFTIPAFYIFTVLNSLQGFFLFIYYYNVSHARATNIGLNVNMNGSSDSSTGTLKTSLDILENPYKNKQKKS